MTRLDAADLEAVLSFLEEAQAVEGPGPFTSGLLDRLADLVGCKYATYQETDYPRRAIHRYITCSADSETADTAASGWWDCSRTVQLLRYRAAHGGSFIVLADAFNRRQRTSADFNCNFRDYGAVDELHIDLDLTRRWFASINLAGEHDFGPREKLLVQVLRPHLVGLYRSAMNRLRLASATATFDPDAVSRLTPRERDVMACVAKGLSNAQIAQALVVERSTVRKHLEHVFDKLGVRSRTAALAQLRADRLPASV